MPKRSKLGPDKRSLKMRAFPSTLESMPYRKALKSHDARALEQAAIEIMEQPDADFTEYGLDDIQFE